MFSLEELLCAVDDKFGEITLLQNKVVSFKIPKYMRLLI